MLIVRLHPKEKKSLETIAKQNGFIYGERGSITQLLKAIANQTIKVKINDATPTKGGKACCFRITKEDKRGLDDTILELNLTYAGKPSHSLLLKTIANKQAHLSKI